MKVALKQPTSLSEIAKLIGAEPSNSGAALDATLITHLATIENSTPGCITFLFNPSYKKYLATTQASAVVLLADMANECPTVGLVSRNPRLALGKLLLLCNTQKNVTPSIHPSVVAGHNVKYGANVSIGPNCVIGDNTELGANVTLQPGVVIGDNCVIGANSEIKSNVSIYSDVKIGKNCTIHSNSVIGSDGFGYAVDTDGSWFKMLHLGGVVIGDDVEIGSNTSIDRGMLDNTVIGNKVIIDNLVQIAHNVTIGERTAIAGCAGVAGSTSIGKGCLIGGASSIAGHLTIGDNVNITGTSSVNRSLLEPGVYSSGFPAKENSVWRKNVARFMFLDSMAKRIRELEQTVNNK